MDTIGDHIKDPTKHWQVIMTLLMHSLESISLPADGPIPWIPKWLGRIPLEQVQEADRFALSFHEHWKWPEIKGDVRYQLYFRTVCASEYAAEQVRLGTPPPADGPPWQKTFSWLLVDMWKTQSHSWAMQRFPGHDKTPKKWTPPAFGDPQRN
jgi:hypothetical protein